MELSKEQRSGSLQVSDAFHVVCPECDKVNRIPQARPLQSAKCGACGAKLFQGKPIELTGERLIPPRVRADPFAARRSQALRASAPMGQGEGALVSHDISHGPN